MEFREITDFLTELLQYKAFKQRNPLLNDKGQCKVNDSETTLNVLAPRLLTTKLSNSNVSTKIPIRSNQSVAEHVLERVRD